MQWRGGKQDVGGVVEDRWRSDMSGEIYTCSNRLSCATTTTGGLLFYVNQNTTKQICHCLTCLIWQLWVSFFYESMSPAIVHIGMDYLKTRATNTSVTMEDNLLLHNVLSSLYFHSRNLVQVVKIRSITSTWNFRDITYFFVLPVSLLSSDSAQTSTPLLLIGRVLQYSFMAPKSIVALYGNVHFLSCYSITWYIGACGSWASSNIFFPKELSLP